jgi:hypothetical protein
MVGDLFTYVQALFGHWWVLVMGGLFKVEPFVEQFLPSLKGWLDPRVSKEAKRRALNWAAILAVFVAGFLAWRDEHNARLEAEKHPGHEEVELSAAQDKLLHVLAHWRLEWSVDRFAVTFDGLLFPMKEGSAPSIDLMAEVFGQPRTPQTPTDRLTELIWSIPPEYLRTLPAGSRFDVEAIIEITPDGLRHIQRESDFTRKSAESPARTSHE